MKAEHLLRGSMRIGSAMARLQDVAMPAWREREQGSQPHEEDLVQISMD